MQVLKLLLLAFVFLAGGQILPAEFKAGESVDFSGKVSQDLYAGGGRVSVNSDVAGDATLGGGDIVFKGKLSGDLLFGGGNANIDLAGADDIRGVAGEIDLAGTILGDVFVAGGEVRILPSANIRGDLVVAGGKVVLDGLVAGNVIIYAGEFGFNGKIAKNLKVRSETARISGKVGGESSISARNLTVSPEARLSGKVDYWSEKERDFGPAAGSVFYNEELKYDHEKYNWEKGWIWCALWFLGFALFTIFLFIWYMPVFGREAGARLLSAASSSLGIGLLYFLLAPALAILLMMSAVGVIHGFLVGVLYGFSLIFAGPISAVILLSALMQKYKKEFSTLKIVFASLGVYFVMLIATGIPVVGFLANVIVVIGATGAMCKTLNDRRKK